MSSFIDPLGRRIILYIGCWQQHIVKRHPIMQGLRKETELTLARPDVIFQSKTDFASYLYYRRFDHPNWGKYYLMVVVDTVNWLVKTAFPVYNFNKGKKQLWP